MTSAGNGTDGQPPQASAWNIANALTISRLALVPVFAWFLLYDDGQQTTYRLLAAAVCGTHRGDCARNHGALGSIGGAAD